MSARSLTHSLVSALLITAVLVSVLYEPVTNDSEEGQKSVTPTSEQHNVQLSPTADLMNEPSADKSIHSRLVAQIAALESRIDGLEKQLNQQGSNATSSDRTSLVQAQSSPESYGSRIQDLEASWISQAPNPNTEAQMESELIHLVSDAKSLGLGSLELGAADCRGGLCRLNVKSNIPGAMLQHLLTRYIGDAQMLESNPGSQSSQTFFVSQTL